MKKILLTTVLFVCIVFQGYTQRFDYENTSKIFFGLNIGSAWHTSDVENAKERFPLGAGFVFGGSINQNYGNAVSFDLRFRYLGGTWYGKDSDTTSAIQNNYAVKPFYDTLGYTVQNFRAAQHRFALELSIHANRFKERTGIDPYIFGGIGITASNINGDLLKVNDVANDGTIYPYNQTPDGSIIDEKYETPLDKNENGDSYTPNDFDFKVLPSLGVGIGYYFNSRFSMGVEHKTTFVMDDYFDGTTVNQNGQRSELFKNDLYHYTSIYFKWYLRGRTNKYTYPDDTPIEPKPQNPEVEPLRKDKPIVDFSNPQNDPHRTSSPVFNLRANVKNVSGSEWITFTQNQNRSTSFAFNPQTEIFQATVQLVPGINTFFIKGENEFGKSRDAVDIYYDVEVKENPPMVKITDPTNNPHTVNQLTYNLKANIINVKARNQITVTFNGQNVTNYNFSKIGNDNFSIPLNLKAGTNTLKIEGRNDFGMDSDETVIIYERKAVETPEVPPVVNILIPTANPYTTGQQNENIVAKVENIIAKQNIEIRINDIQTTNFSFNSTNGRVQFNAGLNSGTNTIRITASNAFGSDYDDVQIIYRRESEGNNLPPKVDIQIPSASPYSTTNTSENVKAVVNNIDTKQQVEVRVNGVLMNNFSFNRIQNSTTHQVLFNAVLIEGNNTVRVSASNTYGNDFDETIIIRRTETNTGIPPVVNILTPNTSPSSTTQTNGNIIAEVSNVNSKSEIDVLINGVQTTNFTYNSSTNRVQFNAPFNVGVNIIHVTASTEHGSDFDETTIIYKREIVPTPPTVEIITPNVNPYTTSLLSENIVAKTSFVATKQQVEVLINGVATSNFSFNGVNGRIQFNASLMQGTNTIKIKVSNIHGNASDQTQVIYRRKVIPTPPTVNIITPNTNPFTTDQLNEVIVANTSFITSKQQVEVLINGTATNNFTFNGASGRIQFNAGLIEGTNRIKINVSNLHGNASDQIQIIYDNIDAGFAPVVEILTPSMSSSSTIELTKNILAKVENVTSKQQVSVMINGVATNNFSFNSAIGNIQFTANLITATNIIKVSATNPYGTHFDEAIIEYKGEPNPPNITFTSPSVGQNPVTISKFNMVAKVEDIHSKNDVIVLFNGSVVSSSQYSYNVQLKTINYLCDLKYGVNTFTVKASTSYGSDEATAKIERKRQNIEEVNPEIVQCNLPIIRNTIPRDETNKVVRNDYTVSGYIENINRADQIKVFINGRNADGFVFNSSKKSFKHTIKIYEHETNYMIKITNKCGTIEKKFYFIYEAVNDCGVGFEMKDTDSEFCLTTPKEIINSKNLLSASNFNYKGKATSLYFKATENGKAKVNGKVFNLTKGNYYHFSGVLTIEISKTRLGSIDKWNICVESTKTPLFGQGINKPLNPCADPVNTKPDIREKPETRKPNTTGKPNLRPKPTRTKPGSVKKETAPSTEENTRPTPRKVRKNN